MKVIFISVVASLALAGVFGDSVFGEKEDAIREIREKYDDAFTYAHVVIKHIEQELKREEPDIERSTKDYAERLKSSTLVEFGLEIKKNARTAVAKSKPLSAFECLAVTSMEGRNQILQIRADFDRTVNSVLINRRQRLGLAEIESALILNAVTELKDQSIASIEKAITGILSLKNDALKKIESGKKQLNLLEESITKPRLSEEYIALKQKVETKYKDTKEALFKRAQKCVS